MNLSALMPHQSKTVEYAVANPYCILALDVGTGKSRCALETWKRVGGNLMIVCPAYLSDNWRTEVRKWLGEGPVISQFKETRFTYYPVDSDIIIISYDLMSKWPSLFRWAKFVIADEANYLMHMSSQRSDAFHRGIYENSIRRLLLLTGTPIKNKVEEYYSLIALCNYNPKLVMSKFLNFYPDSMTFADHFSYRTEYDAWVKNRIVRIIKWSGVKNVEELKEYLKGIYIRFEADQVLTLPPITYKDILTDNVDDPKLLEAFNNFDDENKSVMPEAKRHAAIMKILLTHRYCKDLLAEVGSIVIFSDHVEPVKRLADKFGVPPITGETTTRERTKIAEDFQSGKQKVVVATIGSFSTGINLTAANHLVFNDYPWVPGDMKQAEARIHRMGQTKPCVVHRIFRSPQDFTIMKAIKEKQSVISQVV